MHLWRCLRASLHNHFWALCPWCPQEQFLWTTSGQPHKHTSRFAWRCCTQRGLVWKMFLLPYKGAHNSEVACSRSQSRLMPKFKIELNLQLSHHTLTSSPLYPLHFLLCPQFFQRLELYFLHNIAPIHMLPMSSEAGIVWVSCHFLL